MASLACLSASPHRQVRERESLGERCARDEREFEPQARRERGEARKRRSEDKRERRDGPDPHEHSAGRLERARPHGPSIAPPGGVAAED